MIDDMASLKQAMEQMDAHDVTVSQAGKDRAAQILSNAKLSFSKLAERIEERRLLLRPKILDSIRRMDQPDLLGDAAFREAGILLRRDGQSFRQIADAIELDGRPAPGFEEPVRKNEPLYPIEMESEPGAPDWLSVLNLVARIVFFPLRRPLRFLAIALPALLLFNALRGPGTVGQQVSGYFADVSAARQRADAATSWVSSFVDKLTSRRTREAAAPPTPPTSIPSPPAAEPSSPATTPSTGRVTASPPHATTPAPAANAPPVPPQAAPAAPPPPRPRLDERGVPPSNSPANDRHQAVRPRTFGDLMQEGFRRNSRMAGPCIGGAGGCYWAGGRY